MCELERIFVEKVTVDDVRKALEAEHGIVYDTSELTACYKVEGFMAPWVCVERRSDGVSGTMQFQHCPRFYYGFVPD